MSISEETEKLCLVSHLDGYVRAVVSIDGSYGDSIASVFVASIDKNYIQDSLLKLYQGFCQGEESSFGKYEFSDVVEIPSKNLQEEFEALFFCKPFELTDIVELESLKKTRYEIVWKLIELIDILTNRNLSVVYKVKTCWAQNNYSYNGFIFLFPLDKDFLLIKVLSKGKPEG